MSFGAALGLEDSLHMLVAQDCVTRQRGVEVLRQHINNLWVSKVR